LGTGKRAFRGGGKGKARASHGEKKKKKEVSQEKILASVGVATGGDGLARGIHLKKGGTATKKVANVRKPRKDLRTKERSKKPHRAKGVKSKGGSVRYENCIVLAGRHRCQSRKKTQGNSFAKNHGMDRE